jgi:uncharacterized protein YjbI with pentapeptide repeats
MAPTDTRVAPRLTRDLAEGDDPLVDEADLVGVVLTGDVLTGTVRLATIAGCRLDGAHLTGGELYRCRLVDCLVVDSDLSGVILDECSLTRVEFRECRLSGLQGAANRYVDVGFIGCRIDGANFRMSKWERAELDRCYPSESDFASAQLKGARLTGCDLSGVELSKCDLSGASLQGSTLDGLRGAEALRGVTLSSDQIVPAGLALFGALGIRVSDDD